MGKRKRGSVAQKEMGSRKRGGQSQQEKSRKKRGEAAANREGQQRPMTLQYNHKGITIVVKTKKKLSVR